MLNRKAIKALLAGCLTSLILVLAVFPVLANDFRLPAPNDVTPQTFDERYHHLNIPAAAFRWNGILQYPTHEDYRLDPEGYLTAYAPDCLLAPAYFPPDAVVQSIYASIRAPESGTGLVIYLYRMSNRDGYADIMGSLQPDATMAGPNIQILRDGNIQYPNVKYPDYNYFIQTCINGEDMRLYSIRIYYSNKLYFPILYKN